MLAIISAGIAPGLAILSFFYLKDKYESEPITAVLRSFIFGGLLVFPIMFIQYAFSVEEVLVGIWSQAYLLSGLLEEFFKWFIVIYTVFKHDYFNERYDGIVYSVAVSLGFATVENILYLLANGIEFAFGRAILPVSSHALFGVIMGFYLGKGKFSFKFIRKRNMLFALLFPFLLHGTYDYILLRGNEYWLYFMVPFMVFLWANALFKVKVAHSLDNENEFK